MTNLILICLQCGQKFDTWKCLADKKKFCGKECFDDYQRENPHYKKVPKTAFKKGQIAHNKGKSCSEEQKRAIRNTLLGRYRGENHPKWKGGRTSLQKQIRGSSTYKLWRTFVFERDNYTCQRCNKRGGYLEVHHKIMFSYLLDTHNIMTLEDAEKVEQLWNIDNGIVYCKKCHKEVDGYRR